MPAARTLAVCGLAAVVTAAAVLAGEVPAGAQPTTNPAPSVVPALTSWTGGVGATALTARSRIVVDARSRNQWTVGPTSPGLPQRRLGDVARTIAADTQQVTGLRLRVVSGPAHPGDITLRLAATPGAGTEGYHLDIGATVAVTANTGAGVFYASRTLLQMLRQDPAHRALSRGSTTDAPAKPMRVLMLDMGRKYWQPSYIEDVIREMGWLKMNVLMMHFVESEGFRLNSPAFPGLADPKYSYSRAQIEQFQRLAAQNNVTIMPGFEFPGHDAVVSDYFHVGFGDGPNADGSGANAGNSCGQQYTYPWVTPGFTMNLTNPRSLQVTRRILDVFLPWFTGPYVQVGGDEVPPSLANCPAVQGYLAANAQTYSTLGDLLSGYINSVDSMVKDHGKTTVIYNGFEQMSHPKQNVDHDVVVMDWLDQSGTSPALAGYDTIQAGPSSGLYLTPNNYHKDFPDQNWIYNHWQPDPSLSMLGGMLSLWGDYDMWAQDQYFENLARVPRALVADRLWNSTLPTDSVADFTVRLDQIGNPPGYKGFPPLIRTTDGKPIHYYPMAPAPYPPGWHDAAPPPNVRPVIDTVGGLNGSTYILRVPTFVDDPQRGPALRFAGTGDGVGFGGVDIAEPWSYSVWVKRTGDQPDATLLASPYGALKLQQYQTGARVGFTRFGVADYSFDYSVPLDTWVQLTFVATPGSTVLYADGVQVGQVAASISLPMQAIGQRNGTTLRGELNDMAVYDQALTASQVAAAYRSASSTP